MKRWGKEINVVLLVVLFFFELSIINNSVIIETNSQFTYFIANIEISCQPQYHIALRLRLVVVVGTLWLDFIQI